MAGLVDGCFWVGGAAGPPCWNLGEGAKKRPSDKKKGFKYESLHLQWFKS